MVNQIRIDGAIGQGENEVSAEFVRSQLPVDGADPIRVSIHSEGGSVFEGFAIYDLFANYSGPKTIAVESTAFSIASFIAMAFDEIEMSPNAYLMLHNPRVGTEGDDEELAKSAGMLGQLKSNMVEAYAARSGKTAEEITAILKAETYMNAADAVANGFADRMTSKPVQARAFARLDKMPHGVVAALFGAGSGGDIETPTQDTDMADPKPVAATVKEIKAAFPALAKSKPSFVLDCIERDMPLASVASAAAEEMMTENEELKARVAALEEELAKAQEEEELAKAQEEEELAKAQEEEELAKAQEEEEEQAKAQARRTGVAPIARGTTGKPSASARWSDAVENCLTKCRGNRQKAVAMANRSNPGLRQAMLDEVNSRR